MALTNDDIGRLATDILSEGTFDDIDDNVASARLVKRMFDTTRQAELSKQPWSFAITSSTVSGTNTSIGDLPWRYTTPAGALKVLPLTTTGEPRGIPVSWRQEGIYIYADKATSALIRYVADVTDPANWHPLFVDVMAAALAVKIAHSLTGKPTLIQVAQNAYDRALAEAVRNNAIEHGFGAQTNAANVLANLVSDLLAGGEGVGVFDTDKAMRLVSRNLVSTRQAELRKGVWSFAIAASTVSATDLSLGAGTLTYRYTIPAGALRILPLTSNGQPHGTPISYRVEGAYVYSDQSGPRVIRYINDVTDMTTWDPLFLDVMAGALAVKVGFALTQKENIVAVAQSAYDRAITAAVRANALEYGLGEQAESANTLARLVADLLAGGDLIQPIDNDKAVRLVTQNVAQTRQAELRKHVWNFAVASSSVVGTNIGGTNALNWRYPIPAGALKVLPLTDNGEPQGEPISWRVQGIYVLTDQSTPQVIRYVSDVTDVTLWDPLFLDVVAAALAVKVGFALTGKESTIQLAQGAYDRAVASAVAANAMEYGYGEQGESAAVLARLVADLLSVGGANGEQIDGEKAARLVSRQLTATRQAELRKYFWNFAITASSVSGTNIGGTDALNWKYAIPAGALRIMPLTANGEPHGEPISWRVEKGFVYSDQSTPRIIRYVADITDYADWDPLFTEVVAAALAVKVALPLTGQAGAVQVAQAAYEKAIAAAVQANVFEFGFGASDQTEARLARLVADLLGSVETTGITDNDKAIRLVSQQLDLTRQAELKKRVWNFAVASSSVSGTNIGGTNTLNWRYAIPTGALKILPLTDNGEPHGAPISWRVQGAFVLSDQSTPRVIRYVSDITDPDAWDSLFTDVITAALAVKVGFALTGKESVVQAAQAAYDRAVAAAVAANVLEQGLGEQEESATALARLVADILTGVSGEKGINNDLATRLVVRSLPTVRQAELQKNDWSFAVSSSSVSGTDLATGSGTYNWKYAVPAGALKVLPLTYDGEPHGIPINWRQDGAFIYSDQSSPRIIRYIADVEDPADWPATFTRTVAAALAIELALPLTGNPNGVTIAQGAYDRAVAAARASDALLFGFGSGPLTTFTAIEQRSANSLVRRIADLLSAGGLESQLDIDKAHRLILRELKDTRQAELRKHTWNFALGSKSVDGVDLGASGDNLNWKYPVPADRIHDNIVANGAFASDTIWTKGTGWTISGGAANKAIGVESLLNQALPIEDKRPYRVRFQISAYTTGSVKPGFAGQTDAYGTNRNALGTYTEDLLAPDGTTVLSFQASDSFAGSIDNVVLWPLSKTLRVLPLTYCGEPQDVGIAYRVEGDFIYSDQKSPRTVRFISDIEDADDWDPLFKEVIAAALAVKVARPLTGDPNMILLAQNAYRTAYADATRANALERQGRLGTNSWALERGDSRGWWRA